MRAMLRWPAMASLPCRASRLLLVVLSLAVSSAAYAQPQDRSFNPQLFHPAPGPDEFITVEPARTLAHLQWGVGLFLNYARNEFSVVGYDVSAMHATESRANLIAHAI